MQPHPMDQLPDRSQTVAEGYASHLEGGGLRHHRNPGSCSNKTGATAMEEHKHTFDS